MIINEIYMFIIVFLIMAFYLIKQVSSITNQDDMLWAVKFATILLSFISSIYIGFTLAGQSSISSVLDVIVATGFMIWAYRIALIKNPFTAFKLLMTAFVAHGIFDFFHHIDLLSSQIMPIWYPLACFVYDISIAVIIIYGYNKGLKHCKIGHRG